MHSQHGSQDTYRSELGCPVRFDQTWNGFELPAHVADKAIDTADPETRPPRQQSNCLMPVCHRADCGRSAVAVVEAAAGTNAFHRVVQPACPASTVTVCASGDAAPPGRRTD